jgi:hypothetical protein
LGPPASKLALCFLRHLQWRKSRKESSPKEPLHTPARFQSTRFLSLFQKLSTLFYLYIRKSSLYHLAFLIWCFRSQKWLNFNLVIKSQTYWNLMFKKFLSMCGSCSKNPIAFQDTFWTQNKWVHTVFKLDSFKIICSL